jgi:hypothetical protein
LLANAQEFGVQAVATEATLIMASLAGADRDSAHLAKMHGACSTR